MAQCHLCRKSLGVFGKITLGSEMLDGGTYRSLVFCKSCAPLWPEKLKEAIAAVLCEAPEPVEKFRISDVKTRDPTGQTGLTHQTGYYCYGDLVFMDKGICFLGISTFSESSSLRFSPTKIIRDVTQKGRAYHAYAEERDSSHELAESIRAAARLLFFSREFLVSITYDAWGGLKIDARPRVWAFDLPKGKETYSEFQDAISTYLRHCPPTGDHS